MTSTPTSSSKRTLERSFSRSSTTDDDWFYGDVDTDDQDLQSSRSNVEDKPYINPLLPPNLHPVVSLGVERVSSCYFSISSEERRSVADLLSRWEDSKDVPKTIATVPTTITTDTGDEQVDRNGHGSPVSPSSSRKTPLDAWKTSDVLYHDILMNVFTFLNAQSLAAFSETARRPNFEVFYYLQLQLQRALLVDNKQTTRFLSQNQIGERRPILHDQLQGVAGSCYLSRLASLDPEQAQEVVLEYVRSNSTLRTMPLSHSLAYIRHVLQRNGFHSHMSMSGSSSSQSSTQALASAALFVTVVGAAFMSGGAEHIDSFGTELPNMLFRVGFMGSLMGAARHMSESDQGMSFRDKAEQMGRMMQQVPTTLFKHKDDNTTDEGEMITSAKATTSEDQRIDLSDDFDQRFPALSRMAHAFGYMMPHTSESGNTAATQNGGRCEELDKDFQHPDPYEHLPAEDQLVKNEKSDKKMPSGCVGAYSRAIRRSATRVAEIVKEQRKLRYEALSEDEQTGIATAFLDACRSDENLPLVQEMVETIDGDGFYLATDGTETCAIHTAAFNGASEILDFLCRSIDGSDDTKDGGLCDVNIKDDNGWTALHFAAGGNSVSAVQVLVKYGADLTVEANNGYTAFQWAERLSNEEVVEELSYHIISSQPLVGWIPSQPLSMIAHRFFSFIPSH